MSIERMLSRFVDSDVRGRGASYFRENAVRITEDSPSLLVATVRGTRRYEVDLTLENKQLLATCTCPYVQDSGSICKHIWATVLKAESTIFGKMVGIMIPTEFDIDPEFINDGFIDEDDDYYEPSSRRVAPKKNPAKPKSPPPPPVPAWRQSLKELETLLKSKASQGLPVAHQPIYVVNRQISETEKTLVIDLMVRQRKRNGEWGKPKSPTYGDRALIEQGEPIDRQIHALLHGAAPTNYTYFQYEKYKPSPTLLPMLLPIFGRTGRLMLKRDHFSHDLELLNFDLGPPWELAMPVLPQADGKGWAISAKLVRPGEEKSITSFDLLMPGFALWEGRYAPFDDRGSFAWVPVLKKKGNIAIPESQADDFLANLMALPSVPRIDLPAELRVAEVEAVPRARLVVKKLDSYSSRDHLEGQLTFVYDGEIIDAKSPGRGIYKRDGRKLMLRDAAFEHEASHEFSRVGFQLQYSDKGQVHAILAKQFPKVARELVLAGWLVEAEGKLYRQAGAFKLEVSSGVDWFDLNATADFEGQSVSLPRLLEALRKGENTVVLDDGGIGMVPEEWLEKYGLLARLGTIEGESVRFRKAQVGLLDALLASRPDVSFDQQFAKARDQLRKFEGVQAADPPKAFKGELREYQREGLGWLKFLREFGFGGCLADDMGLGKTVQVLAMLAGLRKGTTLIVVPKSLVFNWKQEAEKFAPKLKVLIHTETTRNKTGATFKDHDIVLTTYGILRMDAAMFAECEFDTCILDESQAAKNSTTETAKAVRLIRADHRLALSGTPIENHLGELWSLFEFLNPGMLGQASLFAGAGRNPAPETRELLAKALRPFILRRTKGQVAKDLPEKTEQTIYCDLEPTQRKLYDELRDHYRMSLLSKIDEVGLNKSKILVLEALLRLRQAACHPGLIDKKRAGEDCAKLDVLMPQLKEIVEEGHKTLVFSQFTSMLSIVKKKLDDEGIVYAYLDGKTNNRQALVDHFQTDPECMVFLISLKAGGVGLNLTAAEYVYLLDPWWNPAAEAQAIDRSHRIGQTKPVFAYRLIARNTVEEKVLALQETKRALADAILGGEGGMISELKREDLEMLFS
jgi:superfamily II DNA or RNA helicase